MQSDRERIKKEINKQIRFRTACPLLLGGQNQPPARLWRVVFRYFHKQVLLLARPAALVTSARLQTPTQTPPPPRLHFAHYAASDSPADSCLPAGPWADTPFHLITWEAGRRLRVALVADTWRGRRAESAWEDEGESRYNEACGELSQAGRRRTGRKGKTACVGALFFLRSLRVPGRAAAEKRRCQILARVGIFIHTMLEEFVSHSRGVRTDTPSPLYCSLGTTG